MKITLRPIAVAVSLACVAQVSCAADEEIEVYTGLVAPKGEINLDLHMNYVANGEAGGEYPGGETTTHRFRLTPEISYGLGSGWDIGAYVPLLTVAPNSPVRAQGVIGRVQWINPHPKSGFFYGGNFELAHLASGVDEDPWQGEAKLIFGWRNRKWTIAANPTVKFGISGPAPEPATFGINTKIGYKLTPKLALGIENYNGTGEIGQGLHFRTNEQSSFIVVDAPVGKWFVHAGLGKGYGGNRDDVIAVLSLGIPIPRFKR